MLTAMTLAVPRRRTNIPRPTKKDTKDTLERAFSKLAWAGLFFGQRGYIWWVLLSEIYGRLKTEFIVYVRRKYGIRDHHKSIQSGPERNCGQQKVVS